jgi:hypothetical protein
VLNSSIALSSLSTIIDPPYSFIFYEYNFGTANLPSVSLVIMEIASETN